MNYIYDIGYYVLLGVSKIRRLIRSLRTPEKFDTTVIKHDGTTIKHEHDYPDIEHNDKLICVFKNGTKHISCAQDYNKGIVSFPSGEVVSRPNKYIEIAITPDGVDIVENFAKYMPHDNCTHKVSWADILALEGIEITYLTKVNIVNHQMEDRIIEDLSENPYIESK